MSTETKERKEPRGRPGPDLAELIKLMSQKERDRILSRIQTKPSR
jgi:hypothetical protein